MRRLQGLFALMDRSLRVDDRSVYTHLFRLFFLGFTYFNLISAQERARYDDALGLSLFVSLCFVNFFFIVLAAVGLFASAISEEKEEMTLGLLKMAGVSGLTLLLGKFAPRLILAAVLLLAQLPFVMLAITLGGVSWGQIVGAYIVLLAFLIFVANLGLFCSVVCPRSQAASALATSLLALYFFGPPIVRLIAEWAENSHWIATGGRVQVAAVWFQEMMYETTAFGQLQQFAMTRGSRALFQLQSVSNTVAGVLFFGMAWALFDRYSRDESAPAPVRPFAIRAKRARGAGLLSPGRAWNHAILWKDFHFHAGGYGMMLGQFAILVLVLGFASWLQWRYEGQIAWAANAFGMVVVATTVAGILCAALAARTLSEEVKWKTLTSLAMLPRGVVAIIVWKVCGALLALIPSVACMVLGLTVAWFYAWREDIWGRPSAEEVAWAVWFCLQYLLLIHLAALLSLYIKWGALPAAIGTIFIVLFSLGIMAQDEDAVLSLGSMLAFVGIPISQVWIVERFQQLAAE